LTLWKDSATEVEKSAYKEGTFSTVLNLIKGETPESTRGKSLRNGPSLIRKRKKLSGHGS